MKSDSPRTIPAQNSRRRFLQGSLLTGAAALAGPALLSACGDGDIVSALRPSRIRVLGDGLSFLGSPRFTVNDGSARLWVDQIATRYGLTLTAADGFAAGNATVADIAGQITAAGAPGANDLFLINAPMQDIFVSTASASTAGRTLADSVRALIASGAKFVAVAGMYDLGKAPEVIALGQTVAFSDAALAFNNSFKVNAEDLGANLLFIDLAFYVNDLVRIPGAYGLTNATSAVCVPPVATACDTTTLIDANYVDYLFADGRHLTPEAHRLFGDYAYDQIIRRW
ncbi:SGNH/GDSL hydrolase family protein [Hydrogenophaga sp.]|uniref:SGNH/GDSL hydrolase family protein n=1 Tax=Hydrogenophaga sp. TaxID=1904254 RepID=UPI002613C09F|nr:SGNH/GDSL hydrolase family protein [Hydrogenophaga sp.]MDM7951342.1 SGNH/GDSL hydrolase family protein [Hydrogenophaga sp.]